jgi:hypothetical protein
MEKCSGGGGVSADGRDVAMTQQSTNLPLSFEEMEPRVL